jgi:(2Fe-2S) ferredoxin
VANLSEGQFKCHVFVCVNNRTDSRKACAQHDSAAIRQKLKIESKNRWPKGMVRVSQTGCLGICEQGPNVMIYPQNKWYSNVTLNDTETILEEIEASISNQT